MVNLWLIDGCSIAVWGPSDTRFDAPLAILSRNPQANLRHHAVTPATEPRAVAATLFEVQRNKTSV